jgi:hypothetical protein
VTVSVSIRVSVTVLVLALGVVVVGVVVVVEVVSDGVVVVVVGSVVVVVVAVSLWVSVTLAGGATATEVVVTALDGGVVTVSDSVHGQGQDDHGDGPHRDHRGRLLMPRRLGWRLGCGRLAVRAVGVAALVRVVGVDGRLVVRILIRVVRRSRHGDRW